MLEELKTHIEKSAGQEDKEMVKHLDTLDKKDLKTTGWTTVPLDNVDHDFVTPLLNNYLKDLDKRIVKHSSKEATFALQLRKTVELFDSEDLINVEYNKVATLKELADQKEHQLELERIRNVHNKKVKQIIRDKVEFKKQKGFKRQNSYLPADDEFGDIDDADAMKRNFGKMRRSYDPCKKRETHNTVIKDVAMHRLEKDIMAASQSDSMMGTGNFRRTGGGGGRKNDS